MHPVPIYLEDHGHQKIYVGCGKCYHCLQKRRKEWYVRNLVELLFSNNVFCTFVTLTYSDEFVPASGVVKNHLQKFLDRFRKRLQRKFSVDTRYFAVSEYGDVSGRPHYHLLLYHNYELGIMDYQEQLNEAWPFSSLDIDWHMLEPASISYVCNYVLSYVFSERSGSSKPFMLSSRRPAIGSAFFGSVFEDSAFRGDFLNFQVNEFKYSLPRYFRDRILSDDTKYDMVETYLDRLEQICERNYRKFSSKNRYIEFRLLLSRSRHFINDLKFHKSKHKL